MAIGKQKMSGTLTKHGNSIIMLIYLKQMPSGKRRTIEIRLWFTVLK